MGAGRVTPQSQCVWMYMVYIQREASRGWYSSTFQSPLWCSQEYEIDYDVADRCWPLLLRMACFFTRWLLQPFLMVNLSKSYI